MATYAFETVDVFTNTRFGGNPLAVFTDARGLTTAQMQTLAFEFNLSETTFVFPAEHPENTASVRIFTPQIEMPFAGHPSVGTAFVIARNATHTGNTLTLEMKAGLVGVELERDSGGAVLGGKISAPLPLTLGAELSVAMIADCVGLEPSDIIVTGHQPVVASVGAGFVIAEVRRDAIARCMPDVAAMRRVCASVPEVADGILLHVYVQETNHVHVRMFAPLTGVYEDPATGSANAALGALLLHVRGGDRADFVVRQGAEMGRPSVLRVGASRSADGIRSTVAGHCVAVMRGEAMV